MRLTRRSLISAVTLGALGTSTGRASVSTPASMIGIQLYMLGPEAAADLAVACRAVAQIGFQEIELPAHAEPDVEQVRRSLHDAGLACPSLHVHARAFAPGMLSLDDVQGVVRAAHRLGARYVVVPFTPLPSMPEFPAGEDFRDVMHRATRAVSRDQWAQLAAHLNAKASELSRADLKLAYHNHNLEFLPLGEGTILDFLLDHTDSSLVDLELDVGWAAAAGFDPAALIRRHSARVRLLHIKDVAEIAPNARLTLSPADVGAGRVDWADVLGAAKAAGVRHYFVEQEPPFARSAWHSARVAYEFLRPRL